jgi:hypothetical protein
MYSPNDSQVDMCPVCNQTRSTKKITKVVSIADKVAEMLCSEEIRTSLMQRQSKARESNNSYADIYDGEIFKNLYSNQVINNDENILNIYLKLDVDGFTSSSSHSSMIMIHAVVLNLDSSERYQ